MPLFIRPFNKKKRKKNVLLISIVSIVRLHVYYTYILSVASFYYILIKLLLSRLVTMPIKLKGEINSDLNNERKKCSFDVEEMASWWYGGEQKLTEKRQRGE